MNFSPSSRTASILLTAVSDSITELEEFFTLSLEITDQMTREFGVELGERSTANVTVLDTIEGEQNGRCMYVHMYIVHTPTHQINSCNQPQNMYPSTYICVISSTPERLWLIL